MTFFFAFGDLKCAAIVVIVVVVIRGKLALDVPVSEGLTAPLTFLAAVHDPNDLVLPKLSVGGVFDNPVNKDLVQAASIPAAESFTPLVENSEHVRAGREPTSGQDPGEFHIVRTAPQRCLCTIGRLLPALIW
jgi:hypothetical protein